MTLSRLAKAAHVSVSTASKAFSMSREVNEQTRQMIFEIARKQGCFKQFFNAKYPKYVIAILCPELDSLYYSGLVTALHRELTDNGCEICTTVTGFSKETLSPLIQYYDTYTSVDGILLISNNMSTLPPHETPIVSIGKNCEGVLSHITIDQQTAVRSAIEYFHAGGCKNIGFIGEPLTVGKETTFIEAMQAVTGSWNERLISISRERFEAGGYQAVSQLFERKIPFDALLCAYDRMAFGAMRCLSEHGISVPTEVKLIGMDNLSTDAYTVPSLSSIGIDNSATSHWAVSQILSALNGGTLQPNTTVQHQLFLRESSKFNLP